MEGDKSQLEDNKLNWKKEKKVKGEKKPKTYDFQIKEAKTWFREHYRCKTSQFSHTEREF